MGYDHADIDTQCRGTVQCSKCSPDHFARRASPLISVYLAVVDGLLVIEVPDPLLAQIALQGGKSRSFPASRRFAYFTHIDYVEINEVVRAVARRVTDDLFGASP